MSYTTEIEEKVFTYIRLNQMLSPGDKVVAGVSGGADSVCLLFVLLEWAKKYSLQLIVVHVDHGIREDSPEDARFVEELCREQNLVFCLERIELKSLAKAGRMSEEEAGRRARYEIFQRIAGQRGAGKIAVAHNCNDRAETMLFNLFRGSGITGLRSIRPVRGEIIRPLLCLERQEIEGYLMERGLTYRTDSTNDKDDYARNRIRHHILPYAEDHIARGCIPRMAQTADMLLETEDYLEQETGKAYEKCVAGLGSDNIVRRVTISEFISLHPVIQKRLLLKLAKELSPEQKDITYLHIGNLVELFNREGNRTICLPHHIRCRRQYKEVILERVEELPDGLKYSDGLKHSDRIKHPDRMQEMMSVMVEQDRISPNGLSIPAGDLGIMEFKVFSRGEIFHENCINIPENQCTKWFDYDKMRKPLELRTRRTGDYFCIKGSQNGQMLHKKVKDYMIGEKIPYQERSQILLIAEENHILWVVGYRISEYYKISKNTKRILQVQLRRDCESSGNGGSNGGAY